MATWAEDQIEYDRLMAEHQVKRKALDAEWDTLRPMGEALITRRLNESSDAELLADDQSKRWLLNAAANHRDASRRMNRLTEIDHPYHWSLGVSWDNRDHLVQAEGRMWSFVAPHVAVPRRYEHEQIVTLTEAMRAWWATWGMGREDCRVDVMERSLSRHASWSVLWTPGTDHAVIQRNGRDTDYAGTLVEVLELVGEMHPAPSIGDRDEDDD